MLQADSGTDCVTDINGNKLMKEIRLRRGIQEVRNAQRKNYSSDKMPVGAGETDSGINGGKRG